MSDTAPIDSSGSTTPFLSPPIDKSPPRPAPTLAYSWKEYNPHARVLYIRDHQEANRELSKLGPGPHALGFDLEWKPIYVKGARENPVALVQLSNNETIFLLQISAMQEFPSMLVQVLADPLIVKTGVAIQNDALKLYKDWGTNMSNCIDLSLLARTVDNARWQGKYNSSLGLARLIESYEYRLLGKGKITRSNWEAHLDPQQVEYAANDAHAGFILHRTLSSMIHLLPQPPHESWFSFNIISGLFLGSDGFHWHPMNPHYNPGPQPPPRPPRKPKSQNSEQIGEKTDAPSHPTENGSVQRWKGNNKRTSHHDNNNSNTLPRPPRNYNNGMPRNPRHSPTGTPAAHAFPAGSGPARTFYNLSQQREGGRGTDSGNNGTDSGGWWGARNQGSPRPYMLPHPVNSAAQGSAQTPGYDVHQHHHAQAQAAQHHSGRGGRPYRGNTQGNNYTHNNRSDFHARPVRDDAPRGNQHSRGYRSRPYRPYQQQQHDARSPPAHTQAFQSAGATTIPAAAATATTTSMTRATNQRWGT